MSSGLIINSVIFIIKDFMIELNAISPYNILNILRYASLIVPYFSFSSCIMGFLQISIENHKYKICDSPDVISIRSGKLLVFFIYYTNPFVSLTF